MSRAKPLDSIKAIEDLKIKFPNYDFSKAVYTKSKNKITVICPIHGEFESIYNNMKSKGKGCAKCNGGIKYTQEDALNKLKSLFPLYSFDKFIYNGPSKPCTITCPIHGDITKVYSWLSSGMGCVECRDLNNIPFRKTKIKYLKDSIEELKNKYPNLSFDDFKPKDKKAKSVVICNIHGPFSTSVGNMFISNYPCPYCTGMRNKNPIQDLIDLKTKFDFSKFIYRTSKEKSIIICPEHGEFKDSYFNIIITNRGRVVCPCCNPSARISNKEYDVYKNILYKYPELKIESGNRSIIKNEYTNRFLELDIYLPSIKLAIEFNGTYWHSDENITNRIGFKSANDYHKYKFNKCKEKDIFLYFIKEEDYDIDKDKVLKKVYRLINRQTKKTSQNKT